MNHGVRIRLADGKLADQECPVVQLTVSTDLHKLSNKPIPLTFLVVDGPNNLVGRHALARMWPAEFQALKNATTENFVKPFDYEKHYEKLGSKNKNSNSNKSSNVVKANKINTSKKTPKSKSKLVSGDVGTIEKVGSRTKFRVPRKTAKTLGRACRVVPAHPHPSHPNLL